MVPLFLETPIFCCFLRLEVGGLPVYPPWNSRKRRWTDLGNPHFQVNTCYRICLCEQCWKESINNKLDCDTKPTTTATTSNQQQTRLDLQGVDHALMLPVHYPWLDTSIRCLVVGILIGTRWNWLKHMCKVSEYQYDNWHTLACPFRKNMYVHVYTYMYICYRHVKQPSKINIYHIFI